MSNHLSRYVFVILASACLGVACSEVANSRSPVAPSAVDTPASAASVSALPPQAHGSPGGPGSSTNTTPGGPRGPKVRGEGTVASLSGDCPTVAMVVRGVRVTTTIDTEYEIGECGNLRPGTKVVVEGDFADGAMTATSILITDQPGGKPVAGEGTIGSLKGTCPTLTMVVHGYPVMTTSDTTFTDGACEDLKPGTKIGVVGDIFGNSVLATEIKVLP